MHTAFGTAVIVIGLSGIAAAQSQPVNVWISQGRFDATVIATRAEPYLSGDPYAGIPVRALGDERRIVAQARVRAWPERNQTRVIVFAVENPAPGKYLETPVATFLASPGDPERLIRMDDFGGDPVSVRVRYRQ
jgi:hypothetical protein